MHYQLDRKAALVTGGASGIGRACVQTLTAEGARALSLDRDPAADLTADVTNEIEVRAAVETAVDVLGGLDILVCCAGISGPVGSLTPDVTAAEWDAVMAVNAKGSFLVAKHAAQHLSMAASPAIVLLASDSALVAAEGMAPYCSSKGAVLMLTKALAVDLAPKRIRVNCVCPSVVDTPMSRADLGRQDAGFADAPFPVQTAAEVANLVAFLASPVSRPVNATHLLADFGDAARSSFPD